MGRSACLVLLLLLGSLSCLERAGEKPVKAGEQEVLDLCSLQRLCMRVVECGRRRRERRERGVQGKLWNRFQADMRKIERKYNQLLSFQSGKNLASWSGVFFHLLSNMRNKFVKGSRCFCILGFVAIHTVFCTLCVLSILCFGTTYFQDNCMIL